MFFMCMVSSVWTINMLSKQKICENKNLYICIFKHTCIYISPSVLYSLAAWPPNQWTPGQCRVQVLDIVNGGGILH